MSYIIIMLIIIIVVSVFNFEIVSLLNSHFGNSYSTKESDTNKNKNTNWISSLYEQQLDNNMNRSPFAKYIKPDNIPTIDIKDLTKDRFNKMSKNFSSPIVIKGFFKDSDAVKLWNLDFFEQCCGNTVLPIIKNGDIKKHKDSIENGAGYSFLTVNDFISKLKKGDKMYINNVSRIFYYHPELLDNMNLETIEPYTGIDMKNSNNVTHLFIGGKSTGSSLHSSITGNFFYNIKGKKKWYLIDPKYSRYLKPSQSRTGLFSVSRLDICNAKKGDYVLNIPRYETVLDEGDLLFNPPWWWHAVENKTDYTIGCANRFSNFWIGFKNNPLYTIIFFSHPISNYYDFKSSSKSRREANLHFDKALLRDILKEEDSIK